MNNIFVSWETKDREPDNQRFKEPVYGIRRTDQTKEGAAFKKAEEDYINRNHSRSSFFGFFDYKSSLFAR